VVDVLTTWSGEEKDSFEIMLSPFTQQSGIQVNVMSTRDLNNTLTDYIREGTLPDIAILPNPAKMTELANQGILIPLDSFLDMQQIHQDYAQRWVDLGTFKGKLYALFVKGANKSTIWYSPTQLKNSQIPTTWQGLITLSNTIARSGKYPWSVGVSSGTASGWPAADWIAELYLNESGPILYSQWVKHSIPWTHASIQSAFQKFGQIVHGPHYIKDAPQSILTTSPAQASNAPFQSSPDAYMCYLGDFAEGFITHAFPSLKVGHDINFFPFPSINSKYKGGVTVGADLVVAMQKNSAAGELVRYLATAQAQEVWVRRGGFVSLNQSVEQEAYPNDVAKSNAEGLMMAEATNILLFGAGDLMPPRVQQAFWENLLTYIEDASQLDSVLQRIEYIAEQEYLSWPG
ncbi:MAG: extracellular solute-binding protein, partial [Ktedonobacteraceae bacterium]|nr:extracellular solute-binding protein [Ktedonobacteraceae bacterium]